MGVEVGGVGNGRHVPGSEGVSIQVVMISVQQVDLSSSCELVSEARDVLTHETEAVAVSGKDKSFYWKSEDTILNQCLNITKFIAALR